MQLIKDIRWALQKAKMRAYLRHKHGGHIDKAQAELMAFIYAPKVFRMPKKIHEIAKQKGY